MKTKQEFPIGVSVEVFDPEFGSLYRRGKVAGHRRHIVAGDVIIVETDKGETLEVYQDVSRIERVRLAR